MTWVAMWMFASFQSTSVPFIQILPVPENAMTNAPYSDSSAKRPAFVTVSARADGDEGRTLCARIAVRSIGHGVFGHGQDLDERHAGRLEGREHPHRDPCHSLRQRRVRRRALLRHPEGLCLLPPGRARSEERR